MGKIAQAAAIVSNYADSYEIMGAGASVAAASVNYDMRHNIIPAILALASPDALTAGPVAWGVQMRDKWWVGLWRGKELAMKVAEKHTGDTVVPLYATLPAAQERKEGHSALRVENGEIVKFDPHPVAAPYCLSVVEQNAISKALLRSVFPTLGRFNQNEINAKAEALRHELKGMEWCANLVASREHATGEAPWDSEIRYLRDAIRTEIERRRKSPTEQP